MIKKNTLLILFLLCGLSTFAQRTGEIAIYTNEGYPFYVVLNGVVQNPKPETNVKIQGLTNQWYGCKIMGDDNGFSLEKNLMVKMDTLVTYQLVSKKGKMKLRFFSETPLNTAPTVAAQSVVVFHAAETPVEESHESLESTMSTTTTTTTTSTTTSTQVSGNGDEVETSTSMEADHEGVVMNSDMGTSEESVNVSISADENGMSMNMSVTGNEDDNFNANTSVESNGMEGESHSSFQETTTITTTTTTTTSESVENNVEMMSENNTSVQETASMPAIVDCTLSEDAYNRAKRELEVEAFDDDQERVAKRLATDKCLSVEQIKGIAEMFAFSDSQLNFMKAAYGNCTDKDNYYELMGVLTFSEDKEALESFLKKQ